MYISIVLIASKATVLLISSGLADATIQSAHCTEHQQHNDCCQDGSIRCDVLEESLVTGIFLVLYLALILQRHMCASSSLHVACDVLSCLQAHVCIFHGTSCVVYLCLIRMWPSFSRWLIII